jgi:hypothetical protein
MRAEIIRAMTSERSKVIVLPSIRKEEKDTMRCHDISTIARERKIHASLLPIIRVSRRADTAAANCSPIDRRKRTTGIKKASGSYIFQNFSRSVPFILLI